MSSPEDIMRKMFLRWMNFRLEKQGVVLRDLRDLFRTENMVMITEDCIGAPVPDANMRPRLEANHDENVERCVRAVAERTKVEWGEHKLVKGIQSKQLGYLEIFCWHLVELGELKRMGLPTGNESLAPLAKAIEERLSRHITLKQFHFRYTSALIFSIVNDCSSWNPDTSLNDLQNLRSAFDNIGKWGIPLLVDPPDVRAMGSVNERGFLMFFALFIPSLEGTAGPKKETMTLVSPPPSDNTEVQRLQAELAAAIHDRDAANDRALDAHQQVEVMEMRVEEAHAMIAALREELGTKESALAHADDEVSKAAAREKVSLERERALKEEHAGCSVRVRELEEALEHLKSSQGLQSSELENAQRALEALEEEKEKWRILAESAQEERNVIVPQLEKAVQDNITVEKELKEALMQREGELLAARDERDALRERIALQDFDGLEAKFEKLLGEFTGVTLDLNAAKLENERTLKAMHALELKMPLFARQGKNTVPPPTGDVTLVFTDVEGSTVQWEWNAESTAKAIRVHNDLMRTKLQQWGGYEVKTEGDAFMVAFSNPETAVSWCMDVQQALLECAWPESLYEHEKSKIVRSSNTDALLYRGLRVRMGVHCGQPSAEEDPVTGRMDYFGPMVNRSARIESVANGGQIVMSKEVYDRVMGNLSSSEWRPEVLDLGVFELKGLNDKTHILQILPHSLQERKFEAVKSKEAELAEEKKKLEEQLADLQSKNNELAQKLSGIDAEVSSQMDQAKRLLADVQAAKLSGLPSDELLNMLKRELGSLLQGQTSAMDELTRAKAVNDELFRHANEVASRREKIAVQSVQLEKEALAQKLEVLQEELDRVRKDKGSLEETLAALRSSSVDRDKCVALEEEILSLQSLQKAMAARIETLEAHAEQAASSSAHLGRVLKSENDRWAEEERSLKATIRDLEARLAKRRSTKTRIDHDSRIETLALKATIRDLEEKIAHLKGNGPYSGGGGSDSTVLLAGGEASRQGGSKISRATTTFDVCHSCDLQIHSGEKVSALGENFHESCFACGVCGKVFARGERFYEQRGKPVHDDCRD